jgi:xylan 1,4-beta-xylosidase
VNVPWYSSTVVVAVRLRLRVAMFGLSEKVRSLQTCRTILGVVRASAMSALVRSACAVAAAVAAASPFVAEPTAALTAEAVVDLTAATTPFRHNWEECVGSGHMLLGTRVDWRTHLKLAKDECGFKRIRGHGLLDDDMSVVTGRRSADADVAADGSAALATNVNNGERSGDHWRFQFYNVDQVFDYLLSIEMQPVVELSFMPSAFVTCGWGTKQQCDYAFGDHGGYKGLVMVPDDYGYWYTLVNALAQHVVERYTLAEVRTWTFEVWNELWGVPFEDYLLLFNASSRGLKDVDAQLRVGGPATMQTQYVNEFIGNATAMQIPFDAVTTHFYPTDPQCDTNSTKTTEDCFADMVNAAADAAIKAGKPFYLTEFNNGLGTTSRDDASAAAFMFRMVGQVQQLDMFSWWTFSDVFEEDWMLAAPFHNGYGLMTMQGTRKPAWRAMQALHAAGTQRYAAATPQTQDRNAPVSVLATTVADAAQAIPNALPCSLVKSALNLSVYVASWHRMDATRFSCDSATNTCKTDPSGPYTDEALCDANCGHSAAAKQKQQQQASVGVNVNTTVLITIKHDTGAPVPTAATACMIDDTHANPQAAWTAMGSPVYPTQDQIAQLDAASNVVAQPLVRACVGGWEAGVGVPCDRLTTLLWQSSSAMPALTPFNATATCPCFANCRDPRTHARMHAHTRISRTTRTTGHHAHQRHALQFYGRVGRVRGGVCCRVRCTTWCTCTR